MPIRFRCAYCNQLMGIARRKAGSVVRCPKCAGQVVVPAPEPDAAHDADPPEGEGDAPYLPDPQHGGPAPRASRKAPTASQIDVIPISDTASGIHLSWPTLAIAAVLIVGLMALMFYLGMNARS